MKEKIGIFLLILGLVILMAEGESILVGLFLSVLGLTLFFIGKKFYDSKEKKKRKKKKEDKKILVDLEGEGETEISLQAVREGNVILLFPPKN